MINAFSNKFYYFLGLPCFHCLVVHEHGGLLVHGGRGRNPRRLPAVSVSEVHQGSATTSGRLSWEIKPIFRLQINNGRPDWLTCMHKALKSLQLSRIPFVAYPWAPGLFVFCFYRRKSLSFNIIMKTSFSSSPSFEKLNTSFLNKYLIKRT